MEKLKQVLDNNKNLALLIEREQPFSLDESIIIPAQTPSSKLGVLTDGKSLIYPTWLAELKTKSKTGDCILIIDNLDEIDFVEQEKFYGIIKYKGVNGFPFPNNVQIVATIKTGNINKINEKILSLFVPYKVK